MTVLVTGARGSVASALLPLLLDRGIPVRAASGSPEKLGVPAGVPTLACALSDPSTFPAALDGVSAVFLYAEPAAAGAFAAEAARAGVEHVVLLSSSSVLAPGAADEPIARRHLDAEQALSAGPVAATFLRPGSFAGNALAWSWSIRSTASVDLPYPNAHTDPIHEADVAGAALAALTDPDLRGRAFTLSGPESLTFGEQVERIAEATGTPIAVNAVSREAWKASMADRMPGGLGDTLLDLWRSSDGIPVPTTTTVEELTGRPARTFAEWARDHAASFTR